MGESGSEPYVFDFSCMFPLMQAWDGTQIVIAGLDPAIHPLESTHLF
jgi:hypothetical protein